MKKLISALLVLVLVFSFAACNSATNVQTEDNEPFKVGFIYLHNEQSTYDLNFLTAATEACEKMGVECINKTNIPEGQECYEAAAELVDLGCSIVFADSFGHEDYLIQAAYDYPNVEFCHATGTQAHTVGLPNFHNVFASIYEGRYLAGVAGGLKLNEMIANGEFTEDEALVGYVGAYPYAEVISGYTSFFLGVRSVCPTATMDVTFTGSWYDEALEKEAANMLINRGCKLISQHADSMGAPGACENAGVPNVTYNGSTIEAAPNTYVISSRINWAPYFEYIIDCVRNNEPIATDWIGTIESGSVELTTPNPDVAAENTVEVLDMVTASILSGDIQVFDTNTWTVNGQHLSTYLADVDTDPAYTGDTEVILDGVFKESQFRSAPYFDIQIDGITILGN